MNNLTAAEPKKICVMGLGYIGLPTASVLASRGCVVHGVDVNHHAIEKINRGQTHITEPELDVIVRAVVQAGQLKAGLEPTEADIFIIAVPTPFKGDHEPDLSYVEQASRAISPFLKPGNLVVLESTSPIGTTEKIAEWIEETRPDLSIPKRGLTTLDSPENRIYLAHCPERVLPGRILHEIIENDRVIGGIDPESGEKTREFYASFVNGELLVTDARTAEMCKLTENASRDCQIAFANELSIVCDELGIDVWELISLANRHPRVNILNPGPGVGGHCIAVDPWFIIHSANGTARLMQTAREVNIGKTDWVIKKVRKTADRFKHPTIACLGLAFKANIDDLRESPSVEVVEAIAGLGEILAVEPYVEELPVSLNSLGVRLESLDAALNQADIIVLLTDHKSFSIIDVDVLREKIVIDTRGFWANGKK